MFIILGIGANWTILKFEQDAEQEAMTSGEANQANNANSLSPDYIYHHGAGQTQASF
jgi:hypothetical protein